MYYIDNNVKELYRIFDQNSREEYLRLDLNENPGGLPKSFVNDVLKTVTPQFVAQYPETLHFTEVLAKYLGTKICNLCLVNGSAEGIRHIIEAFTSKGGKIVGVVPTYAMFQVYSSMYGRNFISVSYTEDLKMPITRILDKLNPDVQLLILVNPNNPLGNAYTDTEIEEIIQAAKKNEITVLIDEAYHYFYPKSLIKYALENDHIFIVRTFSKLFSLAGCRLGYVVGRPQGIDVVQKLCTPHNVNAFALKFAQTILETDGLIDKLLKKQTTGKDYLIKSLLENGYSYTGKEGNFIFIKPKTDAEKLTCRMKEEKMILVKTYDNIGVLGKCLRVTTGEKMYMKRFLDALYELDR